MRRKSIEHIKSVIDLAEAWDVPEIVISPGTRRPMISPSLEKTYGWMYESLENLIPLAKQAGTRLLFENTPYCFTPTIEDLAGVVKHGQRRLSQDRVRRRQCCIHRRGSRSSLLSNHESIGLVHISDTGTETWGHDPIGTGVIDWSGLGEAVERHAESTTSFSRSFAKRTPSRIQEGDAGSRKSGLELGNNSSPVQPR